MDSDHPVCCPDFLVLVLHGLCRTCALSGCHCRGKAAAVSGHKTPRASLQTAVGIVRGSSVCSSVGARAKLGCMEGRENRPGVCVAPRICDLCVLPLIKCSGVVERRTTNHGQRDGIVKSGLHSCLHRSLCWAAADSFTYVQSRWVERLDPSC